MKEIGIDRPRFDVKVCDKVFNMAFIPNLARKRYIDFWGRVEAMIEVMKIKKKKERKQQIDALSDDNEDQILKDIIRITLEANGYEYSEDWWESHTDAEMQLEFVRSVIEGADSGKKKIVNLLGA
jgi:flagellar biosynthesis GTPase FlhF